MDALLIELATMMVTAVTLAYIETNVREMETRFDNGLTSQYYTDPFDNIETPYPAQNLAALRCFAHLYQRNNVWVHLAAPMQSGKTGVMVTLTRLVMQHRHLGVDPRRIFVFTGMSDNDWRTQTKSRFPVHVRSNIFHRSGVQRICESLRRLRGADNLQNVLLFIDESHIATKKDHTPRAIYETLAQLCPRDQWVAKNIRIVTVSATDPAKVITIREDDGFPCRVVRLETTEGYQSIEKMVRDGRMRPIHGDAHTPTAINIMRPVIDSYTHPRYHIIRAAHRKAVETQEALAAAFPNTEFVSYDSDSRHAARDEADSADLLDINSILETQPTKHTFIIIKNAFYAAKTLNDKHVGLMYDRQTDNDAAVLQGLAGRACGYEKSSDTVVFTIPNAIERYLRTWRAVCLNVGEINLAVEEGYAASAQVMNLAVEENVLHVGADELNPLLATEEAMAAAASPPVARAADVLEHRVKFFEVGTDSIATVVQHVKEWLRSEPGLHADVRKMNFNGNTIRAIERHRDDQGRYLAALGKDFRVRTLAEMNASRQNLSFENNHPARLQPCYDGPTLGLALRYLTGNTIAR